MPFNPENSKVFAATEQASNIEALPIENNTLNITLNQAITYMTANSSAIKTAQLQIDAAQINYNDANFDYKQANSNDSRGSTLEFAKVKNGVYLKTAEMNLNIAKKSLDDVKYQVTSDIKNKYYTLKSTIQKLDKANIAYSYANENLWIVKCKFNVGTASIIDVLQATITKAQAKQNCNTITRDIDYAKKAINTALKIPLETNIVPTDSIQTPDISSVKSPNDAINDEVIANQTDVYKSTFQAQIDELTFKVTSGIYTPNTFIYKNAELAMSTTNQTLANAKDSATLNIYKAYNDLNNAFDAIEVSKQNEDMLNQNYSNLQIKYEQGMVLIGEVNNAIANLKDAQIQTENAILNYILAFDNYNHLITLPNSAE
jgi:outer membrane protein TolC